MLEHTTAKNQKGPLGHGNDVKAAISLNSAFLNFCFFFCFLNACYLSLNYQSREYERELMSSCIGTSRGRQIEGIENQISSYVLSRFDTKLPLKKTTRNANMAAGKKNHL